MTSVLRRGHFSWSLLVVLIFYMPFYDLVLDNKTKINKNVQYREKMLLSKLIIDLK